ncbi:hypothetical protein Hanom_Chr10g00948231 [Helianthus anomalus]
MTAPPSSFLPSRLSPSHLSVAPRIFVETRAAADNGDDAVVALRLSPLYAAATRRSWSPVVRSSRGRWCVWSAS